MHCATRLRRSRVVRPELVFTFVYAASSIQNASEQFVWYIRFFFWKFRSSSNPTNTDLKELGLEFETGLYR